MKSVETYQSILKSVDMIPRFFRKKSKKTKNL